MFALATLKGEPGRAKPPLPLRDSACAGGVTVSNANTAAMAMQNLATMVGSLLPCLPAKSRHGSSARPSIVQGEVRQRIRRFNERAARNGHDVGRRFGGEAVIRSL
jgi:hypothetical protein